MKKKHIVSGTVNGTQSISDNGVIKTRQENFEEWWHKVGSGIIPDKDDDMETHAKKIAKRIMSNKKT